MTLHAQARAIEQAPQRLLPRLVAGLGARDAVRHAASLGNFAEGGVAETRSTPGTTSSRLLPLDENPGARRRVGLHHGLLALYRTGRRTSKTALFLVDAAAHIKSTLLPLPDSQATTLRRLGYAAFMAGNVCGLNGFEVRIRGELPSEPAILVCNHVGWQDPILIMNVVPALAVAKHEVGTWPLIGDIARGLDVMLVDRQSSHSGARVLLRARTLLARGASILTFPEGTTSHGDDILPFRRGMFGLARLCGVPVVPIALRYLGHDAAWVGDASFFPHFIKTVARTRTIAQLEFGRPIQPLPGERAEAMAERTRTVMRTMLSRGFP